MLKSSLDGLFREEEDEAELMEKIQSEIRPFILVQKPEDPAWSRREGRTECSGNAALKAQKPKTFSGT